MESSIRFGIFLVVLTLMLTWEHVRPFRCFQQPRSQRIAINLGMMLVNFGVLRLLTAGGVFATACYTAEHRLGLFNHLELAPGIEIFSGLLVLDLAIYLQHRLLHTIPLFWQFHKVHHSDPGFDTTTGVRFHPLEILFSMYYKMALVLALGVSPWTVVVFETILNVCALFNHGNVQIPQPGERFVRNILITPDLHRIHHSSARVETDSNFGFSVPWWDHAFKTYRGSPSLPQEKICIGILEQDSPELPGFRDLLQMPFTRARPGSDNRASPTDTEDLE